MPSNKKRKIVVLVSVFAGLTIIGAAWVANGSEYEDAWLYLTCIWIVLIPALDLLFRGKK